MLCFALILRSPTIVHNPPTAGTALPGGKLKKAFKRHRTDVVPFGKKTVNISHDIVCKTSNTYMRVKRQALKVVSNSFDGSVLHTRWWLLLLCCCCCCCWWWWWWLSFCWWWWRCGPGGIKTFVFEWKSLGWCCSHNKPIDCFTSLRECGNKSVERWGCFMLS